MSVELLAQQRSQQAQEIVASLPDGPYEGHYQPDYGDESHLVGAVTELLGTPGITEPRHIDAFQRRLAAIATGRSSEAMVIAGSCDEEIHLDVPLADLTEEARVHMAVVASSGLNRRVLTVLRNRGQHAKRRTEEYEKGSDIPTYRGGSVNEKDLAGRAPDPSRMVGAADQSRDLELGLRRAEGRHVPAAHDFLLLPYEASFIRQDGKGRKYLASADLPWLGNGLNHEESPQARLLKDVINPVGIKVGPDMSADQIEGLARTLNPANIPGKLVWMLRLGLRNADLYPETLSAIERHAPNSVKLSDVHGTTKKVGGQKIRYMGDYLDELSVIDGTARTLGITWHGVSVETVADGRRREWADYAGETDLDEGGIDPRFNLRQARRVYDVTSRYV